jgi:succinate dehydrogenase/fumarate reductase cytochrome b subunit
VGHTSGVARASSSTSSRVRRHVVAGTVWKGIGFLVMQTRRLLDRLQALSGLMFAYFLLLHLVTTASAARGMAEYDAVLNVLRPLYRPHIALEILLIAVPAAVHIGCGLYKLRVRLRYGPRHSEGGARLHRLSGYVLLLAIVGHVAATRLLPTFGEGPTATLRADFSFLAYSLVNWPWFFVPYYFVLGTSGAIHLGLGVGQAAGLLSGKRLPARWVLRVSYLATAVLALGVTLGVYGMVRRAPHASRARFGEFTALYQRFLPFMHPNQRLR